MSFSSSIKEELAKTISNARHCCIAELAALLSGCGTFTGTESEGSLKVITENRGVAEKCCLLSERLFQIKLKAEDTEPPYILYLSSKEETEKILKALKLKAENDEGTYKRLAADNLLVQNTCCKRAFIRGAFLVSGSVSNPEKGYHFEVVFQSERCANQLKEIIHSFLIEAKVIKRKRYFVVYIKEGSQIVDLLNIMEAHVALMKLENVRIIKDMRNSINRQVNCEAANINKTVVAAAKQTEDILFIRDTLGLEQLPEGLLEIAKLRIAYPDASLKELGELLREPIGKSGVNHRLKKLSAIAEGVRRELNE